jgi:hypothetical protein
VRDSLEQVSNAVEKIETLDLPSRQPRRMAGGPNMAKPPLISNKRNSEAPKDEIPKMDLGNPTNSRRMAAPVGGGYAPSVGGGYAPSAGGSYVPSGGY